MWAWRDMSLQFRCKSEIAAQVKHDNVIEVRGYGLGHVDAQDILQQPANEIQDYLGVCWRLVREKYQCLETTRS